MPEKVGRETLDVTICDSSRHLKLQSVERLLLLLERYITVAEVDH